MELEEIFEQEGWKQLPDEIIPQVPLHPGKGRSGGTPCEGICRKLERYSLHISRQNMANWTIQCADRYLAFLYDYLHEKMYGLPCTTGGRDAHAGK